MTTLSVFSKIERKRAKILLAAKVASMMGRKFEEGDWIEVYCRAKRIPQESWSNLHIDINHLGLGVELKMLRINLGMDESIKSICGTSRMHPALTRSIRIDSRMESANDVMIDIFAQYANLVDQRTAGVQVGSPDGSADMRLGWLLWESELREFLYFEEQMTKPRAKDFYAVWNRTPPRGVRKASRSLWIYDKLMQRKRYSVTTSAGIKIQPYFEVPHPSDPNLAYFRVQSEPVNEDTISLWVTAETAADVRRYLGSTDKEVVSQAVLTKADEKSIRQFAPIDDLDLAVPIHISRHAHQLLVDKWRGVNDDQSVQLFLQACYK